MGSEICLLITIFQGHTKASTLIGAWEVKIEIMTDKSTDRHTNQQMDMRGHSEVSNKGLDRCSPCFDLKDGPKG